VGFFENWATSSDAGNVGGVTDPESACNFIFNNWQAIQNNDSNVDLAYYLDTVGGGGGASNCVANDGTNQSSCTTTTTTTGSSNGSIPLVSDGWPKPAWQTGVSGIPADKVRDIPDVSFFASDGFISFSAYLICVSEVADCTYTTDTEPLSQEVGGTSVSSPAMAGVMALINQKAGEAQGSPNAELYTLASKQTYSNCKSESGKVSNGCLFNDIDTGTIAMPCDNGAAEGDPSSPGIVSPDCSVNVKKDTIGILSGYSAAAGYDLATGLGSLNVANVVNGWPASTATSKATVTVTPAKTTVSAGSALTIAVTVAASTSGGATPTGKVTLLGGGYSSSASALSSGAYSFTIPANSLLAGSDVFTVSYGGDTTFAAATGTATVTVTAVAGTGTATVTVTPTPTTLTAGTALSVAVTVAGPSGDATPTGTVTLSGGGYTSSVETLASGAFTFSIPANSLTAGSDTLTVTYSGDTTYASATGTATVTVTSSTSSGTFTLAATAPSAVSPGTSATSTVTVTTTDSYTGTASLTCALTTSPSGAVDLPACTLSPTTVALSSSTPSGTVTATVTTTAATTTTTQLRSPRRSGRGSRAEWAGGSVLALLVFFGIPARRRSWRAMLGALLLIAALGGLSACGDFWEAPGGNTANGTTTGNYVFTVTGSGSPTVSPAVTTTFTVTVN
jgi:Bacterial Ig-like domain (group 3)